MYNNHFRPSWSIRLPIITVVFCLLLGCIGRGSESPVSVELFKVIMTEPLDPAFAPGREYFITIKNETEKEVIFPVFDTVQKTNIKRTFFYECCQNKDSIYLETRSTIPILTIRPKQSTTISLICRQLRPDATRCKISLKDSLDILSKVAISYAHFQGADLTYCSSKYFDENSFVNIIVSKDFKVEVMSD